MRGPEAQRSIEMLTITITSAGYRMHLFIHFAIFKPIYTVPTIQVFVWSIFSVRFFFTDRERQRERKGPVHYQGTMNNTDPPESSSGPVSHTHTHTGTVMTRSFTVQRWREQRKKKKRNLAWGLNAVWQPHLPFSETNAQLWQPWQPWIVAATLSLDLLHPSNPATQYIPAGCE